MRKYLFVLKLLSILCPTGKFTDSTHSHLTLVSLWQSVSENAQNRFLSGCSVCSLYTEYR